MNNRLRRPLQNPLRNMQNLPPLNLLKFTYRLPWRLLNRNHRRALRKCPMRLRQKNLQPCRRWRQIKRLMRNLLRYRLKSRRLFLKRQKQHSLKSRFIFRQELRSGLKRKSSTMMMT